MTRPVLQIIRDNMSCGNPKCGRMLWDCRCPSSAECTECERSVDDIPAGQMCEDAPDGIHLWKVPDGDGFTIVPDLTEEEQDDIIESYDWGASGSRVVGLRKATGARAEKGKRNAQILSGRLV
jgi:hypothetical protein